MDHFVRYLHEVNDYPRFKRRNKWVDKFLVRFAATSLLFLLVKISAEYLVEVLK